MTELEIIVKNLDKIGTELYNKFGTDSYNIRCELHDIKDQLKAINYTRCCKSDSELFYCHQQSSMKHNRCIKQCDSCASKQ